MVMAGSRYGADIASDPTTLQPAHQRSNSVGHAVIPSFHTLATRSRSRVRRGPSGDAAGTVSADRNSVSAIQCWRMSEVGRVEALKASFRGVVRAAESLDAVRERVEALSDKEGPDAALLSELARIGTGIAVAAAALRSLSESPSRSARRRRREVRARCGSREARVTLDVRACARI